jgi:hypothetical protein
MLNFEKQPQVIKEKWESCQRGLMAKLSRTFDRRIIDNEWRLFCPAIDSMGSRIEAADHVSERTLDSGSLERLLSTSSAVEQIESDIQSLLLEIELLPKQIDQAINASRDQFWVLVFAVIGFVSAIVVLVAFLVANR